MNTFLEVKQLRKIYGATIALNDVSFKVPKGTVHAIIGENGAGKSTLIKILSGSISPNEGTIILDGKPFHTNSIAESRLAGVSTAFQELSLLPNLSVSENLSLPNLKKGSLRLISRKLNEDYARKILRDFDLGHISPSQEVGTLSLAERQKLEITRAISHKPKLLLLDEPTAALPDPEWLYKILERNKRDDLTILYISHRLNEIRDLCQSATILRNGSSIDTISLKDTSNSEIFRMMIGESKDLIFTDNDEKQDLTQPGIEVHDLSGSKIRNISLTLNKGEILGIAGLEGQGQAELFKILAGIQQPKNGQIKLDGKTVKLNTPMKALRNGISYVPEERKVEGILPGLKTLSNITISSLKKASLFGMVGGNREYGSSLTVAKKVQLELRYINMDIDSLSGGNQQKAIMARSLMTGSPYLLLYDPCRGVDVGTKHSFYEMMKAFTDDCGSILWYSTDLSELVNVCDRILVFYKGNIVSDILKKDVSIELLLSAATGHFHKEEGVSKL